MKKTDIRPPFHFSISYALFLHHSYKPNRPPFYDYNEYSNFYNNVIDSLLNINTPDSLYCYACIKESKDGKIISELEKNWKEYKHVRSAYYLFKHYMNTKRDDKTAMIYINGLVELYDQKFEQEIYKYSFLENVTCDYTWKQMISDVLYKYATIIYPQYGKKGKEIALNNWKENDHVESGFLYGYILEIEHKQDEAKDVYLELWNSKKHLISLKHYMKIISDENIENAKEFIEKEYYKEKNNKDILLIYIDKLRKLSEIYTNRANQLSQLIQP